MIEEREQQQNISACIEVLARLKFDKNLIREFLREDFMRESPLYQEILQEGRQQEALAFVLRLLTRRVGTVERELHSRVQRLSSDQLEELGEALLDFSTTQDLVAWLQTHQ